MKPFLDILSGAREIELIFSSYHWQFCFIGGVAFQRWGNPRLTADVDLTLLTGFGNEEIFIDTILKHLTARRTDSKEFALRNRVLLAQAPNGTHADIALGAVPFEEASIKRASKWEYAQGLTITTCSAEDLIIHKVFAGRHKDWADVEGILQRCHNKLNLGLVRKELPQLLELKGEMESLQKLESLVRTVAKRFEDPLKL